MQNPSENGPQPVRGINRRPQPRNKTFARIQFLNSEKLIRILTNITVKVVQAAVGSLNPQSLQAFSHLEER